MNVMMKQSDIRLPFRLAALVLGLFLAVGAFAQVTVNGHVKDAQGEPIIGATIRVAGSNAGAVSDFDGNFSINAEQGSKLSVSYVGYQPATVAVNGSSLVITMQDDAKILENVVVIGYGVAKKNDLTGSVTAIKPDEKNKPLVTSAQEMMQGKIAGVNVTTGGGTPGGGATIRIRGGSSLNASNDPLVVIDGMAIDNQGVKGAPNALAMVNPNDIETFTVLKDASATAIYGSRGSNGVIIITTKKGRKGSAPQVSYTGNVSYSFVNKKVDVLNAAEYRDFVKNYYGEGSDAWNLLGNADTDWQDEIYRPAVTSDHNITVAGGLKNMPYRFSAGFTDQDGVVKTSNYQRTTANLNLNPSLLDDHLKLNLNAKFMYTHSRYADGEALSSAVRTDPTQPVRSYDSKFDNFHNYFTWTSDGTALGIPGYPYTQNSNASKNPVAILNGKNDRANSYDYMVNVEADYQIHGFEDLRLHVGVSGDWANGTQKTDVEPWSPQTFYYGSTGYTYEKKRNLVGTAYAQYYKDFLKTQHVDIMAGYEMSELRYEGDSRYSRINPDVNGDYNVTNGIWKQHSRLQSFYGRFNYIAWDRYMVTATVRRDGSSRFAEHWATFPAVALGWKVNEEAFLKNANWLEELKIRLGWGKTGQQDGIGNYNYFANYDVNNTNVDGRYPITGVGNDSGLLYRPQAYNKNLKWETTETWNAGLDIALFRNRVTASVDYYFRKTTDLINTAYVSAGSNFRNQVTSNIGSLENRGVEASLTVRPIQTKDWQWEVTANFTYNKNEITELTGESSKVKTGGISAGTGNTCQVHTVGYPASSFLVYQQVYDQNGKPLEGVYVDRNADGKISEEDMYIYKSPAAPYLAGLSSRLQYKNWDFGFSLRGSFGNYVYNDFQAGNVNIDKRYDSSFGYTQNSTPWAVENGWKTYDHVLSDIFVQNASFIKLDNITLGYSFNNLFKGGNYKGLGGRLYLTATNVATWTEFEGVDPEVFGGIAGSVYPRPISFTMGLNLNF